MPKLDDKSLTLALYQLTQLNQTLAKTAEDFGVSVSWLQASLKRHRPDEYAKAVADGIISKGRRSQAVQDDIYYKWANDPATLENV